MRVVAITTDLMDRSRISGAIDGVEFARDAAACAGADVVVIDLARSAALVAPVRAAAPDARIVAFGPHVDTELLAAGDPRRRRRRAPPLEVLPGPGRAR